MSRTLRNLYKGEPAGFRERTAGIYAILVAANLSAWAWALIAFGDRPILVGTAVALLDGLHHHYAWVLVFGTHAGAYSRRRCPNGHTRFDCIGPTEVRFQRPLLLK